MRPSTAMRVLALAPLCEGSPAVMNRNFGAYQQPEVIMYQLQIELSENEKDEGRSYSARAIEERTLQAWTGDQVARRSWQEQSQNESRWQVSFDDVRVLLPARMELQSLFAREASVVDPDSPRLDMLQPYLARSGVTEVTINLATDENVVFVLTQLARATRPANYSVIAQLFEVEIGFEPRNSDAGKIEIEVVNHVVYVDMTQVSVST